MIEFDQFIVFVICGMLLSILWVVGLLLAWVGARVWEWVDDGDTTIHNNPLVGFVLSLAGYSFRGWSSSCYEKSITKQGRDYYYSVDGEKFVGGTTLGLLICPPVVGLALIFPTTAGLISLTTFVIFMARSGRRLFKRFERHISDKNAHQ